MKCGDIVEASKNELFAITAIHTCYAITLPAHRHYCPALNPNVKIGQIGWKDVKLCQAEDYNLIYVGRKEESMKTFPIQLFDTFNLIPSCECREFKGEKNENL